jgi:hypothetical protein
MGKHFNNQLSRGNQPHNQHIKLMHAGSMHPPPPLHVSDVGVGTLDELVGQSHSNLGVLPSDVHVDPEIGIVTLLTENL